MATHLCSDNNVDDFVQSQSLVALVFFLFCCVFVDNVMLFVVGIACWVE